MKSLILSLLLVVSGTVQAQLMHVIESSAPIYAGLNLNSISRNMTLVNSRLSLVSSASVTFNDKNLTLVFVKRMPPCPAGMACVQMMPAPVTVKLPVVKVTTSQCSITYTALTPADSKTGLTEEVTVRDFTYSQCAHTMDMPYVAGTVTYKATGLSALSKQVEQATAQFNVNESGFLRAQN